MAQSEFMAVGHVPRTVEGIRRWEAMYGIVKSCRSGFGIAARAAERQ
jgi:hypothetical protein